MRAKRLPVQSFALFYKHPLKTEYEVEQYMKDLGITYYEQYIVIIVDAKNTPLRKINRVHRLYSAIRAAKKKRIMHFEFRI